MSMNPGFATEFEFAGAPRQIAQGWGEHLQRGLEIFTMGLSANQANAFPMFSVWPAVGTAPPMLATPWALLMSNESAIASPNWFSPQLMFPGFNHPELQGMIMRYNLWFTNSFRILRMSTMAKQVFGSGVADPQHRVTGTAFAGINFLQTTDMTG